MTSSFPAAMFSATFAAAGTGKLPSAPLTVIVRPAIGGPEVGGADDEPADAPWLGAPELEVPELEVPELVAAEVAELVVDEPADGVPAEHAATVRLAAQAARASAAGRCLFIAFPSLGRKSQLPTLNARPAKRARFRQVRPYFGIRVIVVTFLVPSPAKVTPAPEKWESEPMLPLYPCPLNWTNATVPPDWSTTELPETT